MCARSYYLTNIHRSPYIIADVLVLHYLYLIVTLVTLVNNLQVTRYLWVDVVGFLKEQLNRCIMHFVRYWVPSLLKQ